MSALAPATAEGWYALHQAFQVEWDAVRREPSAEHLDGLQEELEAVLASEEGEGWSALFRLVGGGADLLLLHFRPTLEALSEVELRLARSAAAELLLPVWDYLSVTEAGFYHATAEAAAAHPPGGEAYAADLQERVAAEVGSDHVRSRLYPALPAGMRYLSFYPMSKRRSHPHNWYALPIEERSRMMRAHGMVGRRYAGRVSQVITGSIGLDDWEWGVTLFARDPLDFKRLVTEMRFDEASALYGDFGSFVTGILSSPAEVAALLHPGGGA
jgi:hydrogen peroxide-dependent heme synthase